jgi:GAF domain-containing protein
MESNTNDTATEALTTDQLRIPNRHDVFNVQRETAYKRILGAAQRQLAAPIVVVGLIGPDHQLIRHSLGLNPNLPDTDLPDTDLPDTDLPDTDLPDTDLLEQVFDFATQVLQDQEAVVISDLSKLPHFAEHPLVSGGLGLRFCASRTVGTADRSITGTFSLIDTKPLGQPLGQPHGEWSADQLEVFNDLAMQINEQLELHSVTNGTSSMLCSRPPRPWWWCLTRMDGSCVSTAPVNN